MTYYMVLIKNELLVVPVPPEEKIDFLKLHGQKILTSGDSIPEVLSKYMLIRVSSILPAKHP